MPPAATYDPVPKGADAHPQVRIKQEQVVRYSPFRMERWQSTYEHRVEINLSESGVHPLTVDELIELSGRDVDVGSTLLAYGQSNGSDELRALIAGQYEGASDASVVVTTGGAEANFTCFWHLFESVGKGAVVLPAYGQASALEPCAPGTPGCTPAWPQLTTRARGLSPS